MDKIKILVIDDDPEFLNACRNAFDSNYQTLCASSREQAQQIMDSRFGLIILGTLSADGRAFMLQRWLKHHPIYRYIPLIIIDAYYQEEGWQLFEGLQLDADEYVSKPVETAELISLVEKLVMNIVSSDRRQTVETWWQGFLALDRGEREILANRIFQLRT